MDKEQELNELKELLKEYLSYGSLDGKPERKKLRVVLANKVGVKLSDIEIKLSQL
jgi:hypothetical protein